MNDINQLLVAKIAKLEQQKSVIEQQAQFLRSVYDNVREAIFVVDVVGDRTFCYREFNAAAVKLREIDDVASKTLEQIFPLETASVVVQHYTRCLESKSSISYEECLPFEGKDTWWLTTLNPLKDEAGKVYRLIGTSFNISDRKQIETELETEKILIETLLNHLSDGIVACDERGTLALFNQASLDFFATPQEPLAAEHYHLYDAAGEKLLQQHDIPLFRAFSGESFTDVELMTKPPQSQPRNLLTNGSPIINAQGRKIGAVVAIRDITQRKQAELALAKLNNELEDRVSSRTNELQQVNTLLLATTATLEERNRELDQFAYVASHDLKAPLRAIANLSSWIQEDLADKLDDETRYNMNLLQSRVHRLENLINGLLVYSRIGRSVHESQSVSVGEMLTEIIDLLSPPVSCTIEVQQPMPILTTQLVPLQQIFNNLLGNAIKHGGKAATQIEISVRELDDYYEFTVADNGKGIDPQYHDRIFTIFETLDANDRQENTGIGLSIVKKAVENQGGKISVSSKLGLGTTFKFTWRKSKPIVI